MKRLSIQLLTFVLVFSSATLLHAQIPTTNLELHIKANAGVTSSGGYVSAWADQSGNLNSVTQVSETNKPTIVNDVINGYPVIRFDGVNDYLTLPSAGTLAIQSNDYEIFIVAKTSSVTTSTIFLLGGSIERYEVHLNGSAGVRFIPKASIYIDEGSIGDYSNAAPYIFNMRATASNGIVQVNGADSTVSALNVQTDDAGTLYLGIRSNLTLPFSGDIAEVIIYSAELSETDRNSVEDYLENKYGINQEPVFTNVELSNTSTTSFTFSTTVETSSTTSYQLVYGTNPNSLSTTTSVINGGTGISNDAIQFEVTELDSNTVYYASLAANYVNGTVYSEMQAIWVGNTTFTKDSLKLWYAADLTLDTYDSDDPISVWHDLTGKGNNAEQSNNSIQPTVTENAINSLRAVQFNGSTQFMELPTSGDLGIQNSDYDMFIVVQANQANYVPIIGNNYGQTAPFIQLLEYENGIAFWGNSNASVSAGVASEFFDNNFHVVNASGTSSLGEIRVNGKLYGSNDSFDFQNGDDDTIYIGTDSQYSYAYMGGRIAEIIIYNKKLSVEERLEVATYLSDKYNLDLPLSTPTVQVSSLALENNGVTSADLSFTAGNGINNLVVMKQGSAVDASPVDGVTYDASLNFGSGDELGFGNFVISNGQSTEMRITNLEPGETYYIAVYSFNGESGVEKYLLTDAPTSSIEIELTTYVTQVSPAKNSLNVSKSTNIEITFSDALDTATITNDSTFLVYGSLSGNHAGSISYANGNAKLIFDPTTDFKEGETVTVSLSKDILGENNSFENSQSYTFTIATNPGAGSFSDYFTDSYSGNPTAMEVADLNGDGYTDVILSRSNMKTYIYINNQDSTFATPVEYDISNYVLGIVAADFDNDGDIDIATSGYNALVIFRNNGNGTFTTSENYSVSNDALIMRAGDLDNDGFIDLVIYEDYEIEVFKNHSGQEFVTTGTFSTDYSEEDYLGFQLMDMNNDGLLDLVVSEGSDDPKIYWIENVGDTYLGDAQTLFMIDSSNRIEFGDLDGDGDKDMVVSTYDYDFYIFIYENGEFTSPYSYEADKYGEILNLIDADSDGDLDILVSEGDEIEVRLNNGSGNFADYAVLDPENSYYLYKSADFNNDGVMDIVYARYDNFQLYLQDPQATLTLSGTEGWRLLSLPVGSKPYSALLSDIWTQGFDGASVSHGSSNVYTWDNTTDHDSLSNWNSITSLSDTLRRGKGVLVYVFSDDNGPGVEGDTGFPKEISFTGFEDSYNDVQVDSLLNQNVGGLTLLGNPFIANLDWNSLSPGNLSSSIYVWDNSDSEWKSWNGSVGSLTNGLIGPLNGFFVQTEYDSPSLTIYQSARNYDGNAFLGKEVAKKISAIKLEITHNSGLKNTSWIQFAEDGEFNKDKKDALKLAPISSKYVQIGTVSEDGNVMDINYLPTTVANFSLPVEVNSSESGRHTISLDKTMFPSEWNVKLVDILTQTETDLSTPYTFDLEKNAQKTSVDATKAPSVHMQQHTSNRFRLDISGVATSNESQEKSYQMALYQNFPNPFNPTTTIKFSLANAGMVSIKVYDVLGRLVSEPISGLFKAGEFAQSFNAEALASGIYFYTLSVDGRMYKSMKMTLIK
ncbi:T9SS type A sorting domain-containing protein [bacterium]|nr:MAG: T9SS type A sorting domain-containing protein [bacterium]